MGQTKDESLLLKLHELALAAGDIETPVALEEVARAMGQGHRGVRTILRNLARANFVKKVDEQRVYMTPQGVRLVQELSEGA